MCRTDLLLALALAAALVVAYLLLAPIAAEVSHLGGGGYP